ncbi:MAG: D-alanyl-D-alanine carboxypeptidase [Defluviitaleaceae bacterium]|nr:D-alanyl-D-alanine carboxypeptidase [Defluviitaleaceae bacterium]MCL2263310.1 D-alanyl-D-alanine carboxypeptidase [Defluviitaleaceae bacterium]MCL2264376.1 D-alanyl-D-alanine carboxypeptidase [Defluviitaleaceae bacterium]
MKKIMKLNIFFLAVVFFASSVYANQPEMPKVHALGAVLMDAETGRVLWGKNEHEPLAMASTTKIMTAVLALESGRMDETVTVSSKAAAAPKVKMHLTAGEKVRLGDLMLALMLESSNDAAVAIAEHLGGTVADFCAQMTEKARQLGAYNTVFETPSGLDAGDHHSTPYDLALITRYALTVPGFIQLTNTAHASFNSDKRGYSFNNRNRLLNEFSGANGVKTGFTNKAGHCFVGAAKRGDMQLISVVLASGWGAQGKAQKWVDTKSVLNFGFDNFEFVTIIEAETVAGNIPVTRSRTPSVEFIFEDTVKIPLGTHEKNSVCVELYVPPSFQAPLEQGEPLGTARVFIGTDFYQEIPLLATSSADRHDLKTSLEKILNNYFGLITESEVNIILPEFADPFSPS